MIEQNRLKQYKTNTLQHSSFMYLKSTLHTTSHHTQNNQYKSLPIGFTLISALLSEKTISCATEGLREHQRMSNLPSLMSGNKTQ